MSSINPSPRFSRGNRRRANHHRAVAEGGSARHVPAHPLIPTAPPEWIDTQRGLDELLDHVREVGRFAYDTEFIGEATYFPRLCLIQVGTHERVGVIDAMAGLDVGGVWELLADPAVGAIVHAGAQDLEPVVRHLDRAPANVFDVQVAAGLAGLPYPLSLQRLAAAAVGAKLGKKLTFTSWDHRPLSAAHLEYAADDVRLLPAIYEHLRQRLEAEGRMAWAERECAALCDPSRYRFDPAVMASKVRGSRSLAPAQMTGLVSLAMLRDEAARHHDVPARSLMKDDVLLEMVKRPVASEAKLTDIRGLPRPVRQEYGQRLLEVMHGVIHAPRQRVAEEPEETGEQQFQIDSLWAAVQSHCLARGVYPVLATSRPEVAEFVWQHWRGQAEVDSRLAHGWRGELIGSLLKKLLRERGEGSGKGGEGM